MTTTDSPSELRGTTLYFDCATGLAGDMTLAALLDLGVPESFVREQLALLPLSSWELQVSHVKKRGMVGKKVDVVDLGESVSSPVHHHVAHKHLHDHHHDAHDHHHDAHEPRHDMHEPRHDMHEPRHDAHDHRHDAHKPRHDAHKPRHDMHEPRHDMHEPRHDAHEPRHDMHEPRHDAHDHHHDAHDHHHDAHPHTHYAEIRRMIVSAPLLADVKARALRMFDRLAVVEAAMHGVSPSEVMFHEVGALDSIVDIVGVAAALSWISPRRIVCRTVPLGTGRVRTAHGLLPVPAPATAALLKGAQVEAGDLLGELTTPTGALIVATHAESYGPMPAMRIVATGHGAGTRELPDRPNILRIFAGHEQSQPLAIPSAPTDTIQDGSSLWEISANIDDMNPQLVPPILDSLLSLGARDAWLAQTLMKKGRPGLLLQVLVDDDKRSAAIRHILAETSTIGLRFHRVFRVMLDREIASVTTAFGSIDVKLGRDPETRSVLNVAPEFESVRAAAATHHTPRKIVYAAALAEAYKLLASR
jgi:hypothetical protein